MTWLQGLAVTLFAVAAVLCAVWLLRRGRREWRTALLLLGAATLGVLLILSVKRHRPIWAIVILDQPVREETQAGLEPLLTRLVETGAERLALVTIGATSDPHADLAWISPDAADLPARLLASSIGAADLPSAIDLALIRLEPKGFWEKTRALVCGTAGRIVLAVTDRSRWQTWEAFDIDSRLERARELETLFDQVELHPEPTMPSVEIRAPLGLLADWDLDDYPLVLEVTIQAPPFARFVGQDAEVTIFSGALEPGGAQLPVPTIRHVKVLQTGAIVFQISASSFKAPGGGHLKLAEGWVRCGLHLKVTIAGEEFEGRGADYSAVRRANAWIVAGSGEGATRLLPPAANEVTRVQNNGKVLFTATRARQVARFECMSLADFQAALDAPKELPFLVVLHELPRSFWSEANVKKLEDAAGQGLSLAVIDPPTLPANAALAARIAKLLPAVSQRDNSSATPTPQTADRMGILHLVFDPGIWGAVGYTPGTPNERILIPDALSLQVQVAQKLIKTYRDRGWLHNNLVYHAGERRVSYSAHPDDRLVVRVAPTLKAADPLTRKIFGSALELRLAASFAQNLPEIFAQGELESFGLQPAPAIAGRYPAGHPTFLPNHAVVIFTGKVPQPVGGQLNSPIRYKIEGESGDRTARAMPSQILSWLWLRGMTTAIVQIEAPKYEVGLSELAVDWPKSGPNPLQTFKADPQLLVKTDLDAVSGLRVQSASWLTVEEAKARLLKQPFFGSLNLEDPQVMTRLDTLAKSLDTELAPLFGPPRDSLALAVTEHGRMIDERIGPAWTLNRLATLSDPTGTLDTDWPKADRWTAPRRFRRLEPTPAAQFPEAARAIYLATVDVGNKATRVQPFPLAYGGCKGEGHVLCLGYSPFELPDKGVTDPHDHICDPAADEQRADAHGPQGLIDLATFVSRLRPEPRVHPLVSNVALVDARGGIDLTVQFRPEQSQSPKNFWEPRLVVANVGEIPLNLHHVNWPAHLAVFRAEPQAITTLCAERPGLLVIPKINGQTDSRSSFYVRNPPGKKEWQFSPVLETVAALALFSGGVVGPVQALEQPKQVLRVPFLLALMGVTLGLVIDRSRWRYRRWFRRTDRELERARTQRDRLDAIGLAEEYGLFHTPPRGSRRGQLDHQSPLRPGDKLEHLRQQVLARFLVGIPTLPVVDRRILTRSVRLDLVVQAGASIRACRDRTGRYLQIEFAGFVAQLLAELYWASGAAVRLIVLGAEEGPHVHGPFFTHAGEHTFRDALRTVSKLPPTFGASSLQFTVEPGAIVIWISDFLAEVDLPQVIAFGAALADEDGRLAGVHIHLAEEDELIGFGYVRSPLMLSDRSSLAPADLAGANQLRVEELRRLFTRAGLAFASLGGEMSGQTLVETLLESGVLDSTR